MGKLQFNKKQKLNIWVIFLKIEIIIFNKEINCQKNLIKYQLIYYRN